MKLNKYKVIEIMLLVLVWILLIASPVFFNENESFEWGDFRGPLLTIIPLFFIFLINRFILVPKLFIKKKILHYLISVLGLVAIFSFTLNLYSQNIGNRRPQNRINSEMERPPPPDSAHRLPPNAKHPGGGPIPPFANLLILSFLLVGFDTGLMTSFRLAKSEQKQTKLEKENIESQLAFLRNQVSPHFFMNTLNNIHSLIDFDADEAKESIIRLSKLMRHLLYESEVDKIPIKKEMDFIKNYVDLMKLRFSDKVKITLNLPSQYPDKSIPPLLFTSYLENAFQHGISYQNPSFIEIIVTTTSGNLSFTVRNSNYHANGEDKNSGIGSENSRKRLDLLYSNRYSLSIKDTKDEYYLHLTLPL